MGAVLQLQYNQGQNISITMLEQSTYINVDISPLLLKVFIHVQWWTVQWWMIQLDLVYTLLKEVSPLIYISHHLTIFHLCTAVPVIDTPLSSTLTVTIGSSLTLSCTSRGSPPDTFTWRKDTDPTVLQSTNITAVDYTSTSAVFRADYSIDSVTTSDSGTYTCTATNPIGSGNTTITVVVSGKLSICSYIKLPTMSYMYFNLVIFDDITSLLNLASW